MTEKYTEVGFCSANCKFRWYAGDPIVCNLHLITINEEGKCAFYEKVE